MGIPATVKRSCKVVLTDEEKLEMGADLAREQQRLSSAEDGKAAMAAQIKSKIEEHRARIGRLSNVLASGYEYRDVDCQNQPHQPKKGWIQIVRTDTGEVIEERAMRTDELQQQLPMAEKA